VPTKKVIRRKDAARKPARAPTADKKTAWAEVRRFTPAYKQLALHDRGAK
jgi:hypothetical protein